MDAVLERPVAAPAQINVRLDRELKEAGDRGLELIGITPSQAVRALWEKAAAGGKDAEAVRDALFGQEKEAEPEMSATQKRKLEVIEEIKQSWQNLADTLGLDMSTHVPMTDEELRESYCDYQLEKWGEL